MAAILRRHGWNAYYVSIDRADGGHDSTVFHFGRSSEPWDLSHRFTGTLSSLQVVRRLKQIAREFGISNALATGLRAYLLRSAGIAYRYWTYGADLDQYHVTPPAHGDLRGMMRLPLRWLFVNAYIRPMLLRTYRRADAVMIAAYQKDTLRRVHPHAPLFFLPHFFETRSWDELQKQRLAAHAVLCRRFASEYVLFSSVRQYWKGAKCRRKENVSNCKGNDLLIEAFAKYCVADKRRRTTLLLVDKGPDVEESKLLARKLGVGERIVWLSEVSRKELDQYYLGANLCLGSFGEAGAASFSAIEPLALGTPCISWLKVDPEVPFYSEGPTLFSSRNPSEIGPVFGAFSLILQRRRSYRTRRGVG